MADQTDPVNLNRSALDPSQADIRRWGEAAIDTMARYLGSIREQRVYPKTNSKEIREKLDHTLPIEGVDIERLLNTFNEAIIPMSRQNGHPRMFGYVQSPGTAIAAIADLLASMLNANLTAWRSAPAAVEIERITIDWIKQILGIPTSAAGLFMSGGSMANLAALAAARRAKAPDDLTSKGVQSFSKVMRVYASRETHHSVSKAAGLLGLGRDNVRLIDVDQRFKIRIDTLIATIDDDLNSWVSPVLCGGKCRDRQYRRVRSALGNLPGSATVQPLDARRRQLRRVRCAGPIRQTFVRCSRPRPIPLPLIRTNGFTCRLIADASFIAMQR